MHPDQSTSGAGPATPDVDSLSAREIELRKQIEQLQDFVENGPERERRAEQDRLSTLPPPPEIQDRIREKKLMDQISRGNAKNELRNQTKSGFLLLLLILATLALGWWIYQTVQ